MGLEKGTEDKNRATETLGSVEEPMWFATNLFVGSQKKINQHWGQHRYIMRTQTLKQDFSRKLEFAYLCCLFRGGVRISVQTLTVFNLSIISA